MPDSHAGRCRKRQLVYWPVALCMLNRLLARSHWTSPRAYNHLVSANRQFFRLKTTDISFMAESSLEPSGAAPKKQPSNRRDAEFVAHLQSLPVEERNRANISSYLEDKRKKIEAKKEHFCDGCWLNRSECMCKDAKPVPSFHRYIIYMHHKGTYPGNELRCTPHNHSQS